MATKRFETLQQSQLEDHTVSVQWAALSPLNLSLSLSLSLSPAPLSSLTPQPSVCCYPSGQQGGGQCIAKDSFAAAAAAVPSRTTPFSSVLDSDWLLTG